LPFDVGQQVVLVLVARWASNDDVGGNVKTTARQRDDVINMVFVSDRKRTPIALASLVSVLARNILVRDDAAAIHLIGSVPVHVGAITIRHRCTPFALLLAQMLAAIGSVLAIQSAVLLSVFITPTAAILSNSFGMPQSMGTLFFSGAVRVFLIPSFDLRRHLIRVCGFPLGSLCTNAFTIGQVKLMCAGFATGLAPEMKAARFCFVAMKVFRSGRMFIAALCAAFMRGFHASTSYVLARVFKKRAGDHESSLFGSDPIPLHLNYTTGAV
jgi:hypothetical protein